MRATNSPQSEPVHRVQPSLAPAACAALIAALLLAAPSAAQTPTSSSAPTTAHKPVRHRKPPAAQPAAPTVHATVVSEPLAPPKPNWPVNDKPADAAIVWNSQGLRIDAANSSLRQILKDVSVATGAKVEGLGADERVFGSYGPGTARDVLSRLLEGSSYNVLMIGDQGQGTPRQIVLTARHSGDATKQAADNSQTASNDEDTDTDEQPQPPPQEPPQTIFRPGLNPGGAQPRTPQQIMQEMQQRQQQMQQQRDQPQ